MQRPSHLPFAPSAISRRSLVDIPRPPRRRHRVATFSAIAVLLALGVLGLSRMRPADPDVERSTLYIDAVRRGELVRQVRGNGSLVPEDLRIVSALTAGRVDRVLVQPGAKVDAGTVLIEMSNPDVQLQSLDAERQVKLAEADLANLRATLEAQRLSAESDVAAAQTELHEAERGVRVADRLATDGLASSMDTERARDRQDEAKTRFASEQRRLEVLSDALKAQLDLRRSEVERLRAIASFQGQRVASMTVRAGQVGVVQSLALQPGQWVNPGQELARVAGQDKLKAVIRVPESDARDLTIGLKGSIDTRNGIVAGHVIRMDPAAQGGTVTVDLGIDGPLPRGARPDLGVDATVEIERLPDVLWVGRPADGSSESTTQLFVLDPDGHHATRRAVKLGRGSADAVEVLDGLKPGERVILSEMSRYATAARVSLK
jgi:multidrug efflux pump subunit AcrA (membrane-fusion protein)